MNGPFPSPIVGFLYAVLLAALDYEARCVRLGPTVSPGDDVEVELKRVAAHFAGVRGNHPR